MFGSAHARGAPSHRTVAGWGGLRSKLSFARELLRYIALHQRPKGFRDRGSAEKEGSRWGAGGNEVAPRGRPGEDRGVDRHSGRRGDEDDGRSAATSVRPCSPCSMKSRVTATR